MDIVRTIYRESSEINELEAAFPILIIYGAYCFEIPLNMYRDVQRRLEQIGGTRRAIDAQMSKLELEEKKDGFATSKGENLPDKERKSIAISLANVLADDQLMDRDDFSSPIQHLGGHTFIYES